VLPREARHNSVPSCKCANVVDTDSRRTLAGYAPAASLHYFDNGHFALDENADAIAEAIIQTFA
jgi:hypothetical protein